MSGGGLVEVLAAHESAYGSDDYTLCVCGAETYNLGGLRAHLADVVTAHLAARLEGCREEVRRETCAVEAPDPVHETCRLAADAAMAAVGRALGLPETQGAALSASDGADGPEGHREAMRAGDGG